MFSFLRSWKPRSQRSDEPAHPPAEPATPHTDTHDRDEPSASSLARALTPVPGVRADLRGARWSEHGLTVEGWITVQGRKRQAPKTLSVWAVALDATTERTEVVDGADPEPRAVRLQPALSTHLDVNGFVTSTHDLEPATFTATLTWGMWEELSSSGLQIAIRYSASDARDSWSPLTHRYRWGSAGHLTAHITDRERYAPQWDAERGLVVRNSSPAAFTCGEPLVQGREIRLPLDLADRFRPVIADWTAGEARCTAPLAVHTGDNGATEVVITATRLPRTAGVWGISLADAEGNQRLVHWGDETWDSVPVADVTSLERRSGGLVRLVVATTPRLSARDVTLTDDGILVTLSDASHADSLTLRGARAVLHSADDGDCDGRFRFALTHTSWRDTVAAPPAGGYRLWATSTGGSEAPVRPTPGLSRRTPEHSLTARASFRVEHSPDDQVYLNIGAPLLNSEKGRFNNRRLAGLHTGDTAKSAQQDLSGVFLESWYGKTFSDNPAPMVNALRAAGVPGPYRVAVADRSVECPSDVEPLIVGSEAYWMALGSSRLIVFNTWLPTGFTKRKGQYVVQTWHGTPLKSLGMDVPHRVGSAQSAENLRSGSREWDLLVSQSPYATEILRRAYVFDGEVAETGYPRNDVLTSPDSADARTRTRWRLGVPETGALILYAPTWRAQDKGSVGPLDVSELSALLPLDHVVAVRGHSVTLRRGSDVTGDRLIDVTSYPEPAELMAAADVLVTDYSSIMFDFAATGRPIVFHTPDYAEYIGEGRGGYFDLAADAPGPLTSTTAELADAIRIALETRARSGGYRAWQQKFVPNDDGRAATRLAQRIADAVLPPAAPCPP